MGEKPSDLPPLLPEPLPIKEPPEQPPKPIAEPPPSLSPHFHAVDPLDEPANEEDAAKQEEVTEETPVEEVQLPVERPATATTWKTTSSQRRYIDELERLLKEERKVSAR
jgi:hypothetical protein